MFPVHPVPVCEVAVNVSLSIGAATLYRADLHMQMPPVLINTDQYPRTSDFFHDFRLPNLSNLIQIVALSQKASWPENGPLTSKSAWSFITQVHALCGKQRVHVPSRLRRSGLWAALGPARAASSLRFSVVPIFVVARY